MSKKRIAVISTAVVVLILFGTALWLNRPVDMTCDLTLTNKEGETMPVRFEVTVTRYLTKRTSLDGSVYFIGKEFRLFTNPPWERRSFSEFIGKLRGAVATSVALDKSRPGTLDNVLWLNIELDRENKIVQLTVSGGGQDEFWVLDWERMMETFEEK